jgi:hypothetical protein
MNWEKHFRSMKPRQKTVEFGGIMHADDLNAVNEYLHRTPAKTQEARKLVSDWATWWVTTGDPKNYTFLVPDAVWDEARNRRLAFNVANAVTAEEKQQVAFVATQGQSSEQTRGEQDRRDPNTGQIFVPPKPPLPSWFWPVVVGSVVLGVGVPIVRKILIPL